MNISSSKLLLLIGVIVINATTTATSFFANAYRIGDAVGILLRTHTPSKGSATLEAYRHQLPRFGVSTKTRFDVSSLLDPEDIRLSSGGDSPSSTGRKNDPRPRYMTDRKAKKEGGGDEEQHLRLSLSFDEGFHHIPWLDVYNPHRYNDKVLENLIITIVYSGSDGSIHAVHRETKYRDSPTDGRKMPNDGLMPKSFTVEYVWVSEADVDVRGGLLVLFWAVLIASLSGMVGSCTSSSADEDAAVAKRYKEKRSSSSLEVGPGFAKRL